MISLGDRPESRNGILFQALEGISMEEKTIGVGIHAASFAQVLGARLAAVASSRRENAEAFAARNDIERAFDDYREVLSLSEVDVVSLAVPNDLHCRMCVDAARACTSS
tara:strand:- start:1380 stop:1706 length:327 start_codon:yes stop_codon:yes gene_type:complete